LASKRKLVTKAEIEFKQRFTKAIRGDLPAARIVVDEAADPATRLLKFCWTSAANGALLSTMEAARMRFWTGPRG